MDATQIATKTASQYYSSYSYTDSVDAGATRYYWVRVEDETSRGVFSEYASAAAKIFGPKNLTATTSLKEGVLLAWDAADGATSYKIYALYNDSREIGETTGTTFFDDAAPVDTFVHCKVVSVGQFADENSSSIIRGAIWGGEYLPSTVTTSSGYVHVTEVAVATGYECMTMAIAISAKLRAEG